VCTIVRFLFLSLAVGHRAVSHQSRFGCKAYRLLDFVLLLLSSSSLRCFPSRGGKKWRAPKKFKNYFPGKIPQNTFVCCMSSLLLRKSTWTTTTTFFRQHTVRFGACRAMSSSSSGMMPRPVSSMMGAPRGRASSSSSSINAKTTFSKINDPTLRRGERVRTFAFGARKATKGQLPEREPSMGLDPENAQAKVRQQRERESISIEKHFDLFFFFLSFVGRYF